MHIFIDVHQLDCFSLFLDCQGPRDQSNWIKHIWWLSRPMSHFTHQVSGRCYRSEAGCVWSGPDSGCSLLMSAGVRSEPPSGRTFRWSLEGIGICPWCCTYRHLYRAGDTPLSRGKTKRKVLMRYWLHFNTHKHSPIMSLKWSTNQRVSPDFHLCDWLAHVTTKQRSLLFSQTMNTQHRAGCRSVHITLRVDRYKHQCVRVKWGIPQIHCFSGKRFTLTVNQVIQYICKDCFLFNCVM